MRDEAPLYYNAEYDFWAVSRWDEVEACLNDKDTFISGRTDILEFIKSDIESPPGMFIWSDQPDHTVYRGVLTKVFTPRRMNDLEAMIRAQAAQSPWGVASNGRILDEPRLRAMEEMYLPN